MSYLAAAGVLALSGRANGPPESGSGLPVADLAASVYGLAAILAALYVRGADRPGARLDISMTDCLLHLLNSRLAQFNYKKVDDVLLSAA